MRGDMLLYRFTAFLLSLPLLTIIFVSVRPWIEYGNEGRCGSNKQYIPYRKFLLALVAVGYFSIWPLWVGGIIIEVGPTAKAEEEQLTTLFGEEYQQYQKSVGRFFPRLFR